MAGNDALKQLTFERYNGMSRPAMFWSIPISLRFEIVVQAHLRHASFGGNGVNARRGNAIVVKKRRCGLKQARFGGLRF